MTQMTTNVKTVILRGPLLTQSGYGVHARQVARWLFNRADSQGNLDVVTEVLPWGNTPWITDTSAHDGLIGRIVQSATSRPKYDVSLQLQLPNEWNPFLADFNIGLTAAVEADRCNPAWVDAVNRMDLVIVPSEFVKSVFTNTGAVTTRIEVIPEAFIDEILTSKDAPSLELGLPTKFNLLVFGQFTGNNPENDRKNLFYTVKWLAETFKDNQDVGVVIKTNLGRNTALDRVQAQNILSQLLQEVQKGPGPRFYLLHGDMSNADVAALYRSPDVKALVTLTRGEGFGLPILEAAASDLPVIATNWSAHTEYLSVTTFARFIRVDATLAPIHASRLDGQIFMEGAQWAAPSEDDAKRKFRKFYDSPSIPKDWARELGDSLRRSHSFESIAKKYDYVLKDVL